MKNTFKKYSLLFLNALCICSIFFGVVFLSAVSPELASADTIGTYVSLTPGDALSSFGLSPNEITDVPKLLAAVFRLALGAAAALSVLMITLGGIEYLSTDSLSGKSEGKDRIKNAIYGLILAIMAYLIMYVINPDTLEFKFDFGNNTSKSFISSPHA